MPITAAFAASAYNKIEGDGWLVPIGGNGMAFMWHVAERPIRAGVSLRRHVADELDVHPGWWIPSLAAFLVWALLPKQEHRTGR
jgi:hypothetical protein